MGGEQRGRLWRSGWGAPACAALGVLVLGLAVWRPVSVGVFHDDGVYVLLGKALAEGHGLEYLGVPGSPPAAKFPPLYPMVLAALWKVLPSFPENVRVFELLNVAFLATAAALLVRLLVRRFDVSTALALVAGLLGLVSIEVWRFAAVPLSESLFIALLLASLVAAARIEAQSPSSTRDWLIVLASVTLLAHTRTVGALMIPALAVALASRGRWRDSALFSCLGLAALTPWALWVRRAVPLIPEPLRDVLGPYGPWLVRQVRSAPQALLATARSSLGALSDQLGTVLAPGLGATGRAIVLIGLAPLMVGGGVSTWRRSRTAVLFLGLYASMLWLWPFKDVRLVVPIVPLIAALLAVATRDAFAARRGSWRRVALVPAALYATWFTTASLGGLLRDAHLEGVGARTRVLASAVEIVRSSTATTAVIGAPDLWAALILYTGRLGAPSARFLPLSQHGPLWGTPQQQFEVWAAGGLTHVLLEHGGSVHGLAVQERLRTCDPNTVPAVTQLGAGATLVALCDGGAVSVSRVGDG